MPTQWVTPAYLYCSSSSNTAHLTAALQTCLLQQACYEACSEEVARASGVHDIVNPHSRHVLPLVGAVCGRKAPMRAKGGHT